MLSTILVTSTTILIQSNGNYQSFFHNLRGYNGHVIIQGAKKRHGPIRVIPCSIDRYTAFSIGRVQFLDSFQFTMQSMEKLAKTLSDIDCKMTRELYPYYTKFKLMRQKGVFPYDYFDSITQLQCTDLPSRAAFYNKLNGDECTEEQYEHAKNIWRTSNCQNFRDYHDLYLKSDVLLLVDFFEKFRRLCLESYGLDALHFYTVPGMVWDAALITTEIELDLIGDEEIYTFLDRSIRGAISQILK